MVISTWVRLGLEDIAISVRINRHRDPPRLKFDSGDEYQYDDTVASTHAVKNFSIAYRCFYGGTRSGEGFAM